MANPLWLLLLVVLVPPIAWWRRRVAVRHVASAVLVSELPPSWRVRLRQLPVWLRALSLSAIAAALTSPVCTRETSVPAGLDMMLLVDVSQSMRGRDLTPDRLGAALNIAAAAIDARPDDRIGLMLFAGDHALVCPLTTDHAALKSRLLDVRTTTGNGTAIGPALLAGLERLNDRRSGVLVVLTDGASNIGELTPLDAAGRVAEAAVPLFVVQTGAGGNVPVPTDFGVIEVAMDDDGPRLASMAARTGGRLVDARRPDAAAQLLEALATLDRGHGFVSSQRPVPLEGIVTVVALLALIGELASVVVLRQWI